VYARVGALPVTNTPEEFAAHMQSEMAKLGKLVQLAGARVE
jgi:tripartite-type tricarboxylate transporter receptor subunit TctC